MAALDKWDSFYVIVGAAAGVLIGLQFVVITLIAQRPPTRAAEAGAAFATPTVVHFSVVLLLAALLRAPWDAIILPEALCGLIGLGGMVYVFIITRRMRTQAAYDADFEDWFFHSVLPMLAYAALAIFGFVAHAQTEVALFAPGAAALVLLFCGIHNAWDAIIYHTLVHAYRPDKDKP